MRFNSPTFMGRYLLLLVSIFIISKNMFHIYELFAANCRKRLILFVI